MDEDLLVTVHFIGGPYDGARDRLSRVSLFNGEPSSVIPTEVTLAHLTEEAMHFYWTCGVFDNPSEVELCPRPEWTELRTPIRFE